MVTLALHRFSNFLNLFEIPLSLLNCSGKLTKATDLQRCKSITDKKNNTYENPNGRETRYLLCVNFGREKRICSYYDHGN